jgi:type II restriction/modification system DNA methylase subunit YeeA
MAAVTVKLDDALAARTPDYLATYAPQVAKLRLLAKEDRSGLIERVAYTWFNRLAALRFMDARGWHPFHARVIAPASGSETQPELLKLTRTGALPEELQNHTDPARLNDLLDGRIPSSDAQGDVYRHLVLAACRFYHDLLPDLFEKLDDETELLLPDDLLTEHSVAHGFRAEITDEDCGDGERANVELLGWLYQFYIAERKKEVMARKSAVPTEDIPAVTQLFTPHWIVRYLVENSLGRLWLLNRPRSKLREHMPYYIEGEPETDFLKLSKPEEIRVLDPAVGSGHMLTYAFDILTFIYEEEGYAPSEIPNLVLRHNLYGLDICPRAAQLAELALVFKAREKSRRFFQPEHLVRPNIIELREVRFAPNELSEYIHEIGLGSLFNDPMLKVLHLFEEAKNFGSLVTPGLDESTISSARRTIEAKDHGGQLFLRDTHLKVLRVLEQAALLTQRYHVVVANPPYMGGSGMNPQIKQFLKDRFADYKADLFAAFIVRALSLTLSDGHLGFMSPFVWMFISSYEDLRNHIISTATITTLVQLEYSGFAGATVPICTFTLQNKRHEAYRGGYIRLSDFRGSANQGPKTLEAVANPACSWFFRASAHDFRKLPGTPIAYWLSDNIRKLFSDGRRLAVLAETRKGMVTARNEVYVRLWHEPSLATCGFDKFKSAQAALTSGCRWFSYIKGGPYRKWFGNRIYLVDWAENGSRLQTTRHPTEDRVWATNFNLDYIFKPNANWGDVTSGSFSARSSGGGELFDATGLSCFPSPELSPYVLGFLNSRLVEVCLRALNPTLHYQAGNIADLPFLGEIPGSLGPVRQIVDSAVSIARADWDNFETSWDFRDFPLLRSGLRSATLATSWKNWEEQCSAVVHRIQELETENNRLFISAYGLDGELQPEVPDTQITLFCNPANRYKRKKTKKSEALSELSGEIDDAIDSSEEESSYEPEERSHLFCADTIREFLSFAVGCIMGRYSLDYPGLILANAGDTLREYLAKVGRPLAQLTFAPDEDGIIPVLDGEWFEDDIVARTRQFLRATFGEATLTENLRFIEESLGKDLQKYFLTDFYKDHLQTYKKRPIYWLIQSPRKGFRVLVYMHRYTRDTMNLVLNRYLREFQSKARNRVAQLTQQQTSSTSARKKTEARKESEKLTKIILECEEWERQTVLPLAQARIELNLDDGVKVNYLKLGEALAPIPGLAAEED